MGEVSTPAQRWSAAHHGIDPAGVALLSHWLRLMWTLAGPLARRRVPPTAVTVVGVVLALTAVAVARPFPWLAGPAVLLAAVCDGVDGAVAVIGRSATSLGARADAIADRLADLAFAAVLWRLGAPLWVAVLAGAVAVGVDLLRRLLGRPGLITVAERPSWTICTALAAASATVSPATWPVLVCVAVWVGLGLVGIAQLCAATGRPA